jgi:phosphate transport system substrate-binding protein
MWLTSRLVAALMLAAPPMSANGAGLPIREAGAAFPQALYEEWARVYATQSGVKVACEAAKLADALRRVATGELEFGALDLPLAVEELAAKRLVQFPTAIGGIVPVVNVPGVVPGALRLNGAVLAEIYLGRIADWSDPALAKLNTGLPLPALPIRPAHQAEASGSTFVFTSYLSGQSQEWRTKVGRGASVSWPASQARNDAADVVKFVRTTPGAVGYVEYSYAAEQGVAKPKLQNREGEFVSPNVMSFQAAAAHAPWDSTPAFALLLVDQPGAGSWPMTAPTFAVFPATPGHPERTREALRFLRFGLRAGRAQAADAGYVALPDVVSQLVEAAWRRQIKGPDGQPVWDER